MSIKVKCAVCGKDYELDDKYKTFAEKYPEKVKCKDCFKAEKKKAEEAAKAGSSSSAKASSSTTNDKPMGELPMTPASFRKVYDALLKEFDDILDQDEVRAAIAGFTSTIIINHNPKKYGK